MKAAIRIIVIVLLGSVGIGGVLIAVQKINKQQEAKLAQALRLAQMCPIGGQIVIEATTPLFGTGAKVTCIYDNNGY